MMQEKRLVGSLIFFLVVLFNKDDLYEWTANKFIPPQSIQGINELDLLGTYRGTIGFHMPLQVENEFISSGEYNIQIEIKNDTLYAELQ